MKIVTSIFKTFLKSVFRSLFLSAVLTLSFSVFAEETTQIDPETLENAVDLLQDPQKRSEALAGNKEAQQNDIMIKQMMKDPAKAQQAYQVAADILRGLANENGGDFKGFLKALSEAKNDPEGLYKKLTPEQREQIQQLSEQFKQNR